MKKYSVSCKKDAPNSRQMKVEFRDCLICGDRKCRFLSNLKLVLAIFIKFLFFHQIIALQKLWEMLFISSKKLFSSLRYLNFCISIFPLFFPVSDCFRGWSKINPKVYYLINLLNKKSITHFFWYLEKEKRYDLETWSIDGVSAKEYFYQ